MKKIIILAVILLLSACTKEIVIKAPIPIQHKTVPIPPPVPQDPGSDPDS